MECFYDSFKKEKVFRKYKNRIFETFFLSVLFWGTKITAVMVIESTLELA